MSCVEQAWPTSVLLVNEACDASARRKSCGCQGSELPDNGRDHCVLPCNPRVKPGVLGHLEDLYLTV